MSLRKTQFLESYHHTASPGSRRLFGWVMRGGRIHADGGYTIRRQYCPGHDWLLCVSGRGIIGSNGKTESVGPGQLAWIAGEAPHFHAADPNNPWQLLWLRVDGASLQAARKAFCAVSSVFTLARVDAAITCFKRIFKLLRQQPPAVDALLHVQIATLLAMMASTRADALHEELVADPGLAQSVRAMRIHFGRAWRITELAQLAKVSPATYFRMFRRVMDTTPMEYLRRVRVNEAKHLLVETDAPLKQIAVRVGYPDPLYFSRDFKRVAGMPPSSFRKAERPGPVPRR